MLVLLSLPLSAAELTSMKGVSVLAVNGQEAESKLGSNPLNDGFNQIVVRMDKEVGRGSGNKVFTSKPYVISFDVTGDVVKINHPTARSIAEAKKAFAESEPKWILEQDGKALEFSQQMLPGKQGLFPYMDLDELVLEYNNHNGIYFDNGQLVDKPVEAVVIATTSAVAVSSSTVKPTMTENKEVGESHVSSSSSNVEQLKAWYLKSSTDERKAFRRWMIDQE
nr:DUF2057 domain-containing protein [Vibrio pacinii]